MRALVDQLLCQRQDFIVFLAAHQVAEVLDSGGRVHFLGNDQGLGVEIERDRGVGAGSGCRRLDFATRGFDAGNGVHYGFEVLGRGAATAADDVDQSGVSELAEQLRHEAWALVVTAELVGQTRIGIGAHEGVGDARDLGDVGAHLARTEGAIEPDRERRGVTHRIPERRRSLPRQQPPRAIGDGAGDHHRHMLAA